MEKIIPTSSAPHRWALLLTVSAGLLLVTLDNTVLFTALPTLTRELGATASQSLWIINAYPLVMAGLLLGSGSLGDRWGHRKMFLGGLLLFGIASLLAAFAPSAEVLIGARAFLAIGAAAMMPATLALVRIAFVEEQERNLAIAVWGSTSIIGIALGPILGGFLLQYFWWGSVFIISIPVVVAAFVSGYFVAPRGKNDSSKPWDFVSAILGLLMLSGLVISIKCAAKEMPSWEGGVPAMVVAAIAGALFAKRQYRLPYPLLDFAIFRNPAFVAGILAAVCATFTISGVQLLTTQRFQLISGFSPLEAGLLVSLIPLGCLSTSLLGGAFLHKIGLRLLIGGGLSMSFVGVVITTFGLDLGLGWTIVGLLITGGGLGAVMAVASTAIVGNSPPHRAGMASSVESVSFEFGNMFAVALLGSLLNARYSASVKLPAGSPASVRENVVEAVSLARSGGNDTALFQEIAFAYDQSYLVVMSVVAGVLFVGSVITIVLLRRYGPGSQSSAYSSH